MRTTKAGRRLFAALFVLHSGFAARAAEPVVPPPADPLTVRLQIEDAKRFARVFAASHGKPSAEALQREYLDKGTYGVAVFTPYRIEDAATLAKAIADDPVSYERAIEECLPDIERHNAELRSIYLALRGLFPDKPLPQIYIVFGAGSSGGTAGPNAQVLGLEVLCRPEVSPNGLTATLREFFAHETVHTFQQKQEGPSRSPLLSAALKEGAADFIASIVTAQTPNPGRASWASEREAQLWAQFQKDMIATQPDKAEAFPAEAKDATRRWIANYKKAPSGWPHEVGYWIGMRIWQSYYEAAEDKRQAIRDVVEWNDPEEILRKSGYGGGKKKVAGK